MKRDEVICMSYVGKKRYKRVENINQQRNPFCFAGDAAKLKTRSRLYVTLATFTVKLLRRWCTLKKPLGKPTLVARKPG